MYKKYLFLDTKRSQKKRGRSQNSAYSLTHIVTLDSVEKRRNHTLGSFSLSLLYNLRT